MSDISLKAITITRKGWENCICSSNDLGESYIRLGKNNITAEKKIKYTKCKSAAIPSAIPDAMMYKKYDNILEYTHAEHEKKHKHIDDVMSGKGESKKQSKNEVDNRPTFSIYDEMKKCASEVEYRKRQKEIQQANETLALYHKLNG